MCDELNTENALATVRTRMPYSGASTNARKDLTMARTIVDISMPLENDVISDPAPLGPKIDYIDHEMSLSQMLPFSPGLKAEDLPDGEAWAVERVELITHNGTHLDAPYHFASTMNNGERAITIDEVPIDWCMRPGAKLDFRAFDDGFVVSAGDVEAELKRIGHTLQPLDIVVINTRAGSAYGEDDYVDAGCGMGYEATMYLLERGVRVTGTAGTRPSPIRRKNTPGTATLRSSGKATRRAARSAIAISRNCTIWRPCPATVSPSAVSR